MSPHKLYDEEIKRRCRNRHYYLKVAFNSLKLNQMADVHLFSIMAEKEQESLDKLNNWFPYTT